MEFNKNQSFGKKFAKHYRGVQAVEDPEGPRRKWHGVGSKGREIPSGAFLNMISPKPNTI